MPANSLPEQGAVDIEKTTALFENDRYFCGSVEKHIRKTAVLSKGKNRRYMPRETNKKRTVCVYARVLLHSGNI